MAKVKSVIRLENHSLGCGHCREQLYTPTNNTRITEYGLTQNPDFLKLVAKCGKCGNQTFWVREFRKIDEGVKPLNYTEPELREAEVWAFSGIWAAEGIN